MNWKKKSLAGLLAAAALTGCLAGCAPATMNAPTPSAEATAAQAGQTELDPANPVTVTFYTYGLSFPTMKSGTEHLINSFNETIGKEKGIVVQGIADENYTKHITDIQAGNQVDVIQQTFPTMDVAKEELGIQAFEDVFPADELAAHFEGISDAALSLGQIDGKTYGMAYTFSTPILFINADLFRQAGLDPEDPPKTWDEVLAAAQQITEKTGKAGFAFAPDNGWVTYGLLYSNGAEMFNEDRTACVFASEEGIEALEKWKEFYTTGCAATGTSNDVSEQFMAGNAGMTLNTTAMLSGFLQSFEALGLELTGTTMPAYGDKTPVPVNSGSALCVRPDSELKAKAIWEFVKYVTGPEGYTIITSEIGYLPLRTELADDPKYLKDFCDQYPLVRTNISQLANVRGTIWPAKVSTEGTAIFTNALQKAITTDADVGETMRKAQDDINKLF